MKISYVTSGNEHCGIAHYSRNLLQALSAQVSVSVSELVWPNTRAYFLRAAKAADTGDLVHIEFEYGMFMGLRRYNHYFAAFLDEISRPVILTCHGITYGHEGKTPSALLCALQRIYRYQVLQQSFPRLAHLTVSNSRLAGQVIDCGVEAGRITRMFLPIPELTFPKEAARALRLRLGLGHKFVAVIAGFIHQEKGYDILLNALPHLPEDIVLLIAGQSSKKEKGHCRYEAKLQSEIETRGLSHRVIKIGALDEDEFLAALGMSDLVMLPYSHVNGSSILTTALALKKNIISSNLQAFEEFKERYPCFESIAMTPPHLLIERIEALYRTKKQESLSEPVYAKTGVSEALSFKQRAKEYVELYKRVMR